jgi:hypothetical protein
VGIEDSWTEQRYQLLRERFHLARKTSVPFGYQLQLVELAPNDAAQQPSVVEPVLRSTIYRYLEKVHVVSQCAYTAAT